MHIADKPFILVEAFYFGLGGDDKYGRIANMNISSL